MLLQANIAQPSARDPVVGMMKRHSRPADHPLGQPVWQIWLSADHCLAQDRRLARERQAGPAHLAAGGAEGPTEATETGQAVAQRRIPIRAVAKWSQFTRNGAVHAGMAAGEPVPSFMFDRESRPPARIDPLCMIVVSACGIRLWRNSGNSGLIVLNPARRHVGSLPVC